MIKKIKKILFPSDFSKSSENAFYYAINFAKTLQAEILIFHSYRVPEPVTEIPLEVFEGQVESVKKETTKQITRLIDQGKLIEPSLSFSTLMMPGKFTDILNDIVIEKNIDLVIMGTEGTEPLKAIFMGVNAARILENVSCPVLIVPKNYSFEPIQNIFFPSEFLESDIENTKYISDIAEAFHSEITIGNIANEEILIQGVAARSFEKDLKRVIKYPKIKFICLEGKDIEKSISDYAEKKSADLIVMSTHHRRKFEKLFNKSITKKVAIHTHIPLLALHA